ncbi:MAG: NAD(P)H-dependent oxidoreductase subunit E [Prevotellaceae bacterium]|jgi:NADH-quinone oxidoreductase E subunit|nr:NAD(P)H-dependent oxidoreductase subunit E [Prevotellaceae bacterium]
MNQPKPAPHKLPDDHVQLLEQIDAVVAKYEAKPSNLIMILHAAQGIYGYLPYVVQKFIADKMHLSVSEVSGVVTFYSFFSTKPKGKHTILVCMGTACYVRGGKKLLDGIQKHLHVDVDETTEDGKFTLNKARCIGACGLAPAMMIDDTVYKAVNPNKLESILSKY